MTKKNLPIKVIIQQDKYLTPNKLGGEKKFFKVITPQFIGEISSKFANVATFYNDVFKENSHLPAVGKVVLIEDAIAKSHRPNDLLKDLDVIGAGDLQELYIKVTKQGLQKTITRINMPTRTKVLDANLTTIQDIIPIYAEEKLSLNLRTLSRQENSIVIKKVKIKCFNFGNEYDDAMIRQYVKDKIVALGYEVKFRMFGEKLNYFRLTNVQSKHLITLSQINGIKYIDIFTEYTAPSDNGDSKGNAFTEQKNIPISDTIIGIIDSGISETSVLNKYVIDRKVFIPTQYQNNSHGTFVASCLQYGSIFDNIQEEGKKYFKLLDVVALPNSDARHGLTDTLSQDDFYDLLEEVMNQYSGSVKIWNISLGASTLVEDEQMSDMAVFCDYIQDTYKVQLIIACGNYGEKASDPLRTWPPQDLGENDRVTVPADSARAISVGSVALKGSADSLVKKGEPSPFSRRGPGANYIVKPEVVDFGGNLTKKGSSKDLGVVGLTTADKIIEGIGTSYSTPKVTYKYAKILDDLVEKDLLLSKAFLIHNARVNSKNVDIENESINYYGFGQPSYNTNDILQCSDNEITLVFKQTITRGIHLEMIDFPYPKCLIKNGKYTGEVVMTLAYNPPVDQNYGSQYCRTNIDVSFGTYRHNKKGELKFAGQVPLEKEWADRYESSRVTKGYKWSPVKSYYRNFKNGMKAWEGWKIRINMIERDDLEPKQDFILIVTIKGRLNDQVYNDVVLGLQNQGFISVNLETQYQIREKVK